MLAARGALVAAWRSLRVFVVSVSLAAAGGCATLFRGVTQDVQVATDPIGAVCELRTGDGAAVVDTVATTPGYVRVRKGLEGYRLDCRADGYLDSTTPVEPGVENASVGSASMGAFSGLNSAAGPTFTSTVLGTFMPAASAATAASWLGIAGAVSFLVDLASGALFEFPVSIALTLVPSSFADRVARDRFFDGEETRLRDLHAAQRRELVADCRVACQGAIKSVDDLLVRQLDELQRLRAAARVRG
ncbi:MAG: hypothetical protein ABI585_04755 [Betaproteobacteria bacterium]